MHLTIYSANQTPNVKMRCSVHGQKRKGLGGVDAEQEHSLGRVSETLKRNDTFKPRPKGSGL